MSAPPSKASLFPTGTLAPATAKTLWGNFYDYVLALLGSTGSANDARTALGAAASGANSDIASLSSIISINGGPLAGLRNKLIGGHFTRNPWQRGTSFTVTTTGTYVADRWRVDFDGTANITVDKVALATAQLINGVWCSYGLRILVNSKAGNAFMRLSQRIEDVDTLTTLPATLQTAIQGSGPFSVPVNARQNFGTGGSPSADVVTPFVSSLSVTASMQQLNTGLTVPTITGKTLGTANDFLAVEYDLLAVPAAGYVVIPLAGFECGNVATVWEDRRRLELALCQRYYETGFWEGAGAYISGASASIYGYVTYKSIKRAIPTVTGSSAGTAGIWNTQATGGTTTNRTFGTSSITVDGFSALLATSDVRANGNWSALAEL